jgi:hypothetical protein
MPKKTTEDLPRFRRKLPSEYPLVQFRSDMKTKADIDERIELLIKVLKKDSRFKRFRKNDVYMTCLDLGISYFISLLKDHSKVSTAHIEQAVKKVHLRRELQWASDKKLRSLQSVKKQ